ncbi:MAG: uracil phosphoribosyltransferase [Synergistales bacterium]|nr:uracil phosphoribosyltransferase [Synergistales bacterium]
MYIAIGADHAGFHLKEELKTFLADHGHSVDDFGVASDETKSDFPDFAFPVARSVAAGSYQRGILICGTGIGMSIAANKVNGIRAALCRGVYDALQSRRHNNANILALGGRTTGVDLAKEIVYSWVNVEFEGGRHQNRLGKLEHLICEGNVETRSGLERATPLHVLEHPLIQHKLGIVRNRDTTVKEFRELVQEIAGLMVYEVTRYLPLTDTTVETPLKTTSAKSLEGKKLAVVPVLRAGLGMVEGILGTIPNAKVGHVGMYRDPETLEPVEYYCKLPGDIHERDVFIVDPMLATGGSASAAITLLKKRGSSRISLVCLIAAPEGVARVQKDHPDIDIFTASLDEQLDQNGFIVPGLGDAGDRLFGTR